MSVMVKICGLTDAAAVAAAVDSGADAIGFVFAKSVRRISAGGAREIAIDVPPHVLRVAVMLHPLQQEWAEVQQTFQPDVLQTDIDDFDYLDVADGIRRWPVIREGAKITAMPEEYVYEGSASGSGQKVDWNHAATLARQNRMILAGGLDAGNVQQAVEQVQPWGVDASSAVESEPGKKDAARIRQFIAAAKATNIEPTEQRIPPDEI